MATTFSAVGFHADDSEGISELIRRAVTSGVGSYTKGGGYVKWALGDGIEGTAEPPRASPDALRERPERDFDRSPEAPRMGGGGPR